MIFNIIATTWITHRKTQRGYNFHEYTSFRGVEATDKEAAIKYTLSQPNVRTISAIWEADDPTKDCGKK